MWKGASISLFVAVVPLALAHGIIEDPAPRLAGLAMKAACGEQVYNNQKSDSGGNVQGILQVAKSQKDYNPAKCNINLCKGYQFEDNTANVQRYSAGQTIPLKVAIKAPHTGVANVSIVDTKTNQVLGQPLISFRDYASNAHSIPANNTQFSVTMPNNLAGKCGQAGQCVMQWFWDAPNIKQTYTSCVDFTMGMGAPGTPGAPASRPRAGRRPAVKKRQVMESMTNGPKTTLGVSTMPAGSMPTMTSGGGGSGPAMTTSGPVMPSSSAAGSAPKMSAASASGLNSNLLSLILCVLALSF